MPILATKGSRVLEEKVTETEVSKTVFSHLNVRYSHCSNRCRVLVRCVSFSRSVNVSSNKISAVVVSDNNTFKVFVFVR